MIKRYYKNGILNIINYRCLRQYTLKYFIGFIYIDLLNQFTHNVATAIQLRVVQLLNMKNNLRCILFSSNKRIKNFYHNITHC